MARKQMTLSYPHLNPGWWSAAPANVPEHVYRVEKAVNQIKYLPGSILHPKKVEELCNDEDWIVNIVGFK